MFSLVPILMSVLSVTSIFSELGCFTLVPHFPHNVRCSLYLGNGLTDYIELFV